MNNEVVIHADYYRQCRLIRKLPGEPTLRTKTWLPIEYAVPGNILKLQLDGKWLHGWSVKWASLTMLTGKIIDESIRDVPYTRIPPERIRNPNRSIVNDIRANALDNKSANTLI